MRSKEGEPHSPMVLFYTGPGEKAPGTWHLIPLEQAKGQFGELDFVQNWQGSIREVWLYGPGRGKPSRELKRMFANDKIEIDLPAGIRDIEELPAGSYIILGENKIVSKK